MSAFLLGTLQLVLAKGTRLHRMVGYGWVSLMLFVAISSFWIHGIRMVGPFSWIHLLSAFTIVMSIRAVLAARGGDIKRHKRSMLILYFFALVVTGAFTLLPGRIMHEVVF